MESRHTSLVLKILQRHRHSSWFFVRLRFDRLVQGLSEICAYLNGSGISNLRWVALSKGLQLIKAYWKEEYSDRGIGFAKIGRKLTVRHLELDNHERRLRAKLDELTRYEGKGSL